MRYFFDLDGTLIDSSQRHTLVLSSVLAESNFSFPVERLQNFISYKSHGFSTLDYLNNVLGMDSDTSRTVAHMWVERIEDPDYLKYDRLYDDVFFVLDSLGSSHSNEIMFITARKHPESLLDELDSLDLTEYAEEIFVVDPVHAAVEKINILLQFGNTRSSLIIGDTEVEYHASLATGIPVLLLNRGFRCKEYWDGLGLPSYPNLFEALYHYPLSSIPEQSNNVVRKQSP